MKRLSFNVVADDDAPLPSDPTIRFGSIITGAKLLPAGKFAHVPTESEDDASETLAYLSPRGAELNCAIERIVHEGKDGIGIWKKEMDLTQRQQRNSEQAREARPWTPDELVRAYAGLRNGDTRKSVADSLGRCTAVLGSYVNRSGLQTAGIAVFKKRGLDPAAFPRLVHVTNNKHTAGASASEQRRLLAELNDTGFTDDAIADWLGVDIRTVGAWRAEQEQMPSGIRGQIRILIEERS